MATAPPGYAPGSDSRRPWTFYALATLFGVYLLFLYGPMIVIYILSFQGENGGVTFPMVGTSLVWFENIFRPHQMANIPASFERSLVLASVVSVLTVVISVAAGLGFRRRFPGAGRAVRPMPYNRRTLRRHRPQCWPASAEPNPPRRARRWRSGD